MANEVPFLFTGPTKSRFYFIGGDHWVVSSDGNAIAALKRKQYSRWQFALSFLLIPGTIASIGILLYFVTVMPEAFWAALAAAFAAGLPMFYIYRTEMAYLSRRPTDTFILRPEGVVEVQGETYRVDSISDLTFLYTFYRPSGGVQGDSGHSELDIVLVDGSIERKINLLSQTSNWALKHTRKLEQLTGIRVERNTIAR